MTAARRTTLRVLAGLVVFLALVMARVHVESARELHAAETATANGDVREALLHLRRAARWGSPFPSPSDEALLRLRRTAEQAEAEGDTSTALYAWRAIRGSNVANESLFTPHADETAAAEQHIASLMARVDPPQIHADESEGQRRARYLAALAEHGRPNRAALLSVWIGLAIFLVGLGGIATRGFDAEDRPVHGVIRRFGAATGVGFALLVAGLAVA